VPFHLLVFFVTALVCHGELARTRPPASRLTDFYLCIAVGGVLGGIFNAVLAPALFNSVLEYPLTILFACAVRPRVSGGNSFRLGRTDATLIVLGCASLIAARLMFGDRPPLGFVIISSAVAAMICLRMSRDPVPFSLMVAAVLFSGVIIRETRGSILLRERNFFGVREVRSDEKKQMHLLMHGTTKHGAKAPIPPSEGSLLVITTVEGLWATFSERFHRCPTERLPLSGWEQEAWPHMPVNGKLGPSTRLILT
jgi:hypothetical protein